MHSLSRRSALGALACLAVMPVFAADKAPLAIKGYDPVAYFTVGKPVQGRPGLEVEWDDRRYRFSTAQHRDLFQADPVRYAPQFPDYCAMSLAKGEVVEANPESWLISGGKLYMFGKTVGPEVFSADLGGNIARANQHRRLVENKR